MNNKVSCNHKRPHRSTTFHDCDTGAKLQPKASCDHASKLLSQLVLAGIGWGAYSIVGRNAGPAFPATAASFSLALPICFIIIWALPKADQTVLFNYGVALVVLLGVITSAMGYAIWYRVLPRITSSIAAVSQLTVPVLAITGGILLLNEVLTLKFVVASALVLGGVAIALGLHRTMASE